LRNQRATVVEPLAESARLARDLAHTHCPDHANGRPCRAYHAFWQYLRLMGLGKTLSGMSARYLSELAAFFDDWKRTPRATRPRVLISGCADYSATAHVLHASRGAELDIEVTALDVCRTPLELNRWYAQRCEAEVRTVQADILDHRDDTGYDLVVTSSFLGYFDRASRPRLFARYAALLREAGVLMLANRLRAESEDALVGFDAEQAARFADRAATLSASLPSSTALSPDDARAAAEAYAREFASYPVNSVANVRALAEAAGFAWLGGDATPTKAQSAAVTGPTLSDGAQYLFVVLRKP
jgi:hypothetical protein